MGEYNLINRIPSFGTYWHKMEQHGGAGNGYMIFCDGMSSAGQVAALHLDTTLCEGQKMYFSGFVGNPGNETGKTCPNFTFAVQGSLDGVEGNVEVHVRNLDDAATFGKVTGAAAGPQADDDGTRLDVDALR
jgi:hypothetical protein